MGSVMVFVRLLSRVDKAWLGLVGVVYLRSIRSIGQSKHRSVGMVFVMGL